MPTITYYRYLASSSRTTHNIMEFTLEENDEVMDMNKSFYISDDLDIDLKQIQEPMFEGAQLDFKNISLDEETMKKKSYMTQG